MHAPNLGLYEFSGFAVLAISYIALEAMAEKKQIHEFNKPPVWFFNSYVTNSPEILEGVLLSNSLVLG